MGGTNHGTSESTNATPPLTQRRYGEELRQQKEQCRKPQHTLGLRKRKTHYVTPLLNDAHRKTYQKKLNQMLPARVRTITTSTYEPADIDQKFTLSELEVVLHRLRDTVPGEDTVCCSMIKNAVLSTRHLFLRLINQSFTGGRLPTTWKMIIRLYQFPRKTKRLVPSHYFRRFQK